MKEPPPLAKAGRTRAGSGYRYVRGWTSVEEQGRYMGSTTRDQVALNTFALILGEGLVFLFAYKTTTIDYTSKFSKSVAVALLAALLHCCRQPIGDC